MNPLDNELIVQILSKNSDSQAKSLIFEGDKLQIKTTSIAKPLLRFIELINPWNQLIFCRWLKLDHISEFIVDFPKDLISGNYILKYSSDSLSKVWIFTHNGKFKEKNWYIAYGLTIDTIEGLEVRLAIPRTFHPYTIVEHLKIIGKKQILTDGDSQWLSIDLENDGQTQNRSIIGFKAWIKQNYLLFHPDSLANENVFDSSKISQYLIPEAGIESNDKYVQLLAKDISGKSIISLIYQISHRIHQHVKYRIQKGEFGAKYAVLNRQGDCTEFSALFVALCRYHKIPARLVAGFKKSDHGGKIEWIRHAWAEFFYNGQWIPIDILEGYTIGNFPENIPLFRGNWIGEAYKQELKVIVKDPDLEIDLSKVFLEMKYNIFDLKDQSIPKKPQLDNSKLQFPGLIIIKLQENSSIYNLNLKIEIIAYKGRFILIFYVQENVNKNMNIIHPKIIIKTIAVDLNNENIVNEVSIKIPEIVNPEYSLGSYLCTQHGDIKAYNEIQPFKSLKFEKLP